MEKLAEFCLEQSQKNTAQMFDVMKNSVTATAEMLTWAQRESQQMVDRMTQQGVEQFVNRLQQIQEQQVAAQKELQEQFRGLINLFTQKD
ncbi:hypothetical protein EFBL_2395 [Effusibacillus lacus]|uniref:Uncharacterized protein n=2 Tax=Effusibacillus lacus TaxID=1348429 RepID=A0A292YQS2_9BACL|nr:hypothetical protein EFBL_2395 [Effusibacillus lacus]